MSDGLLVTAASQVSRRTASICEEIDSIWLYVSEPGSLRPAVASWLLNTPEAPAEPTQGPYRSRGAPPPVPAARLLPGGAAPVPAAERWSVRWSADGHAAAALLDGQPIGCAQAGQPRGWARYVRAGADPWVLPFDAAIYDGLFGPES